MSLETLRYLPIIVIVSIVALPIAFLAMNPAGFVDIIMATGQFITITIMDIIKGGFAVLWWVIQAIGVTIGNVFIWLCNNFIGLLNALPNALNNILPEWLKGTFKVQTIPYIDYLSMPKIDPTISSIVNEVMDGYTKLKVEISDYWSTVQANAPMSYVAGGVAGAGSAGATYLMLAQEASTRAISKASSETRASKSTSSTKTSRSSSSRSSSSRSSRSSSSRSSGSTQRTAKKTTKISSEQERELEQRRWQASLRRRHIK